jgi:hypothetical protein
MPCASWPSRSRCPWRLAARRDRSAPPYGPVVPPQATPYACWTPHDCSGCHRRTLPRLGWGPPTWPGAGCSDAACPGPRRRSAWRRGFGRGTASSYCCARLFAAGRDSLPRRRSNDWRPPAPAAASMGRCQGRWRWAPLGPDGAWALVRRWVAEERVILE